MHQRRCRVPFDAGAVATRSFANVAYGPDGHDLLRAGHDAEGDDEDRLVEAIWQGLSRLERRDRRVG